GAPRRAAENRERCALADANGLLFLNDDVARAPVT
ncbi:MAG: hypothetical protein ACI8UR_002069, partial [Natronomonas sp.]